MPIMLLKQLEAKPLKTMNIEAFNYKDLVQAESMGLISVQRTIKSVQNVLSLTDKGRDVLMGKLELYVPKKPTGGGRAKGTSRKLRATWLTALPDNIVINQWNVLL